MKFGRVFLHLFDILMFELKWLKWFHFKQNECRVQIRFSKASIEKFLTFFQKGSSLCSCWLYSSAKLMTMVYTRIPTDTNALTRAKLAIYSSSTDRNDCLLFVVSSIPLIQLHTNSHWCILYVCVWINLPASKIAQKPPAVDGILMVYHENEW